MKISLISFNPSNSFDCIDVHADTIAHGIRSISSCLKQKGHTTQVIFLSECNTFFSDRTLNEITGLVKESDIIGISCISYFSKKAIQVINHLKKLNKLIIWGGIHATTCPEECIQYVDIVCIGEGEDAVCELVDAIEKGKPIYHIKNFWFRKNRKIIKNPVRPLIKNLDSLPFSDYDFNTHYILDKDKINRADSYYSQLEGIAIHTVRGCPNKCSYCCNSYFKKLYSHKGIPIRKRTIEKVIEELKQLKDKLQNLRYIWISDDDFFIRPIQELELFAKEYKKEIGLPFQCNASPNNFIEQKLKLLLSAGLIKFSMGVQTGSEGINKNFYNRNIPNQIVINVAQILNKYKNEIPFIEYSIIITNPYETDKDLIETIKLLQKLPSPYIILIHNLVFFPRTPAHKKAKHDKIIRKEIYAYDFFNPQEHFKLKNKESYLNFLIYLMNGKVTSYSLGKIPRVLLPILTNKKIISYFKKHESMIPKIVPFVITFKNLPLRGYFLYPIYELSAKLRENSRVYSTLIDKTKLFLNKDTN